MILNNEQIESLKKRLPCRERQVDLLNAYLWPDASMCPSVIVVHGASATGKSVVLEEVLREANSITHSIVKCDECVTTRILLQRAFRGIVDGLKIDTTVSIDSDNYSSFFSACDEVIEDEHTNTHVLVLDRIDRFPIKASIAEIIGCFARQVEFTQTLNMVVLFTITSLQPHDRLIQSSLNLHFPRYTQDEAKLILRQLQLRELDDAYTQAMPPERFWANFSDVVIDGLISYTGTDIRLIKDIALKLWPEYIKPVIDGRLDPSQTARLYKEAEDKFTSEWAVSTNLADDSSENKSRYDLPAQTKFLLIAAYLASYNPPKTDSRFFTKAKDIRISKRQVINGTRNTALFSKRSLAAPSFEIERMLAIFQAIVEHEVLDRATISSQIATLGTLRLLLRAATQDPLASKARWRANVGWSMIQRIAESIQFDIRDYLFE